ncbi:MAG TPA: acyloxyacyl hydrolase [Flavobacterium sp.]|nr:acyloxyacyl hydrolase [Flavobacterium sp.]
MKHIYFIFLICSGLSFSQEDRGYTLEASYFYGQILKHSERIAQFADARPEGFLLAASKKTFGEKSWQALYNYPDYGLSLHYQDMKNEALGEIYGFYGHYNFYFFNRNLMFRVAQGISYNTNPYDAYDNPTNYAYGTHWMPSTYFMLNYKKENVFKNLGIQAGISFFHHSNANLRSPNTGTNTLALNVAAVYEVGRPRFAGYLKSRDSIKFTQPVKFNFALRTGFNEGDAIGSGQYPFYVFSAYADKRINRKSALQLGADFFAMKYFQKSIEILASMDPGVSLDTDYRKGGVFIGHELFINRLSLEIQLGYYAYRPLDYLDRFYQRLGLKFYVTDKIYGGMSLKTHMAQAEALEFSLGVRL